jgi:hypothetical protein
MPESMRIYLIALRYCPKASTCSIMADMFDSTSHDDLTRMLRENWLGHTRFDLTLRSWVWSLGVP